MIPTYLTTLLIFTSTLSQVTASYTPTLTPSFCLNPTPNTCDFYLDCLESRYKCSTSGYPLGYGYKYCSKFKNSAPSFTHQGQKWIVKTMSCLQRYLISDALAPVPTVDISAKKRSRDCEALRKKAFGTHPECYIQSGVCTLPVTDWIELLKVVRFEALFQSWESLKATVDAVKGCGEFYHFLLKSLREEKKMEARKFILDKLDL